MLWRIFIITIFFYVQYFKFTYADDTEDDFPIEKLKSYDGAQLLRISNIPNEIEHLNLVNLLEDNYGGQIWKKPSVNTLDVSIEKQHLDNVKKLLEDFHYTTSILIENIQKKIEENGNFVAHEDRAVIQMNWEKYQNFRTINLWMDKLQQQNPNLVKVIEIGKSHQRRHLRVIRITNNLKKNRAVWVDGGMHAREWISVASVTYVINELVTKWNSLPPAMRDITWYILPCMNPDGYEYSRNTDRLWRKNRRKPKQGKSKFKFWRSQHNDCYGVDLNNNWNLDFNATKDRRNPCNDYYGGPWILSEPETKSVAKFLVLNITKLSGYISFHSYGQQILYAYGVQQDSWLDAKVAHAVAQNAVVGIKNSGGPIYTIGHSKQLGYLTGASDDWVRTVLPWCRYSYRVQLRDNGANGFLLSKDEIIPTGKDILEILRAIANSIGDDKQINFRLGQFFIKALLEA